MKCDLCDNDALRFVKLTQRGGLWLCVRHILAILGS